VIVISSILLNKSIGMSSRTQTFFSYKLHRYYFKILNGQQTLKHRHRLRTCKNIPCINLLIFHYRRY
jgi:hypothetical protein